MQVCICFAIFLGIPEGIDHKNRSGGADLYWFLSILCRPARVEQTVLYLFCYIIWTSETASFKKKGNAEQVCIGCYRSLVAPPEQTNSFEFVFVYYCESKLASLRKIGIALSLPQHFHKTIVFDHF